MSVEDYIRNRKVKHFTVSGVEVFEKDPLSNNLNAKQIITSIFESLPTHLLSNVDTIYIGKFDFLQDRQVQAAYENSSIFVTNDQENVEDMVDDIVHEIAHSVEERYMSEIYSDKKIENEFLQKRKNLWMILKDQGYNSELQNFLNVSYSVEFDNYLYQEVGYPVLAMLTANSFYSPYAVTSLREYFANGFEAFFMGEDIDRLKKISPQLFMKITMLLNMTDF